MKIKTIKNKHYNLHLIKNDNFKTVLLKTVFWDRIKEEEITIRNMLIDNLLFSSKNYPTVKDMSISREELYGLSLSGYSYRKGSYIISEISMSVIEDKYGEDGLLKKSIKFYFDVLNNPNVISGSFDKDAFKVNFESLKTSIKRINENPSNYSLREYRRLLGNKIYTYPIDGDIDDLNNITPSKLFEYYNKFISSNNVDIFIIGNFCEDEVVNLINELYIFDTQTGVFEDIYLSYDKEYTCDKISSLFNQSRLLMGASIDTLSSYEKKYVSLIFNIIFGNSPNSKLFLNVREKHSYAYSISSNFSRFDGTFIINAGISKINYEDTKKQVLSLLLDMKNGKFLDKDINDAKEVIIGVLNEIDDYQNSIINYTFNTLYLNEDSKEDQIKNIKNVTKEDIVGLAKKINIDTILLVEEKNK